MVVLAMFALVVWWCWWCRSVLLAEVVAMVVVLDWCWRLS